MKKFALLAATIVIGLVPSAHAQPNPPSFVHEFADPGNSEAKALAERTGMSVGEATRQLRLERQAANFIARARQQGRADEFLLSIENGKLRLFRKSDSPVTEDEVSRALDPDLRASLSSQTLRVSPRELKNEVERLRPLLAEAPGFVGFQLKRKEGEIAILTTAPTAMQTFINAGAFDLPEFVSIEQSEPIVLTAQVRGGRAALYNTGSCEGGTWGYVVYDTSDQSRRAITTAAHVSIRNSRRSLYFSTRTSLTDCRSGTAQSFVGEWRGRNDDPNAPRYGSDLSIHRSSSDTYDPSIWDGSSYRSVRYATTPATGAYLCKFGKTTGQTCGVLQDDLIWSNGYGYMSWVKGDAGVALMTDEGDSGGPVWSGFTYTDPVGLVHGQWGATNLLYTEIWNLVERNTGYFVLSAY